MAAKSKKAKEEEVSASSKQVFWYPNSLGSYDETGGEFDEYSIAEEPFNPWDCPSIGPYTLPGVSKVDVTRERKIDKKKSPGTHGATITDQGYNPAEVAIRQVIWKPSHWAKMADIIATLEPEPSKKKATPFDIIHPATAIRKIKSIYVERIDGPKRGSIEGTFEFEYKCIEWAKPLPDATVTPSKSIQNFDNELVPGREAKKPTPPSQSGNESVAP